MGIYQYLGRIHSSLYGSVASGPASSSTPSEIDGAALPIDMLTLQIIQNAVPSSDQPLVLIGAEPSRASLQQDAVDILEELKNSLLIPESTQDQREAAFARLPTELQLFFVQIAPGIADDHRILVDIKDAHRVSLLDQVIESLQLSLQTHACKKTLEKLKVELSNERPDKASVDILLQELNRSRFHRHLYLPLLDKLCATPGADQSILTLRAPFSQRPMLDDLIHVLGLMEQELSLEALAARMDHFDLFLGDQVPWEAAPDALLNPNRFQPLTSADAPNRIAMISYELAVHGVKYGGLGEAVFGLSSGLAAAGHQVSVFTPKFDALQSKLDWSQAEVIAFNHVFDGVLKTDRCYHMVFDHLHVYFLEEGNPLPGEGHYAIGSDAAIYQDKPEVPGKPWYGLHRRIAYFSSSAIGLLNHLQDQFQLAVIHDWHGAVALPSFPNSGMRMMLVIHNNHYQGVLNGESAEISGFCGNDPKGTNALLNAIQSADQIVGVSATFVKEMQSIQLGAGIASQIIHAALDGRVSGIINGSNPKLWNPETHPHLKNWNVLERTTDGSVKKTGNRIDLSYSASDPNIAEKKGIAKNQLQLALEYYYPEHVAEFGLDVNRPLFLFIGRYESNQKGVDQFLPMYRQIHAFGGCLITMGAGEDLEAVQLLNTLEDEVRLHKGNAWITRGREDAFSLDMQQGRIEDKPALGGIIRAAADYVLCPSSFEPCGLVQFEAWLFGSLVIGTNTGGLGDTIQSDPTLENFNGFTFPRCSDWKSQEQTDVLCEAIRNAYVFWNEREDVEKQAIISNFMRHAATCDWRPSIEKYLRVFAAMLREPRFRPVHSAPLSIRSSLQLPLATSKQDGFYSEGSNTRLHEEFGAHLTETGVRFKLLAPHARSVTLRIQERSNERLIPMHLSSREGIWQLDCEAVWEGSVYEYIVEMQNGKKMRKSDPFAFGSSLRPDHTSVVRDPTAFAWSDQVWLEARKEKQFGKFPLSICEVHLGSFKEKTHEKFPNYRELAHDIALYCEKMGYTHLEIFGLIEHPSDQSLGYQISGLFSSTSRFGSLEDFQYFVNYMHEKGIGVILDWVPYHFATNSTALGQFDGHPLYEDSDPINGVATENWKTHLFDYSKQDVQNFVLSSARYACEHWHIDGFRVDAAGHLMQLDKGKEQFRPVLDDPELAHLHPHGIEFLKQFNRLIHEEYPGLFTIAESWDAKALDTLPIEQGGLGFDAAWTVASQSLHGLLSKNNLERSHDYASLTGIAAEHFHCPAPISAKRRIMHTLSHDEFREISLFRSSGRKKRANTLLTLSTIMLSPSWGYLLFMGTDYGMDMPWNSNKGLRLEEGKEGKHRQIRKMVKDLNQIYKNSPAFWSAEGFEWVVRNDPINTVVGYHRTSADEQFLVLHNYSDHVFDSYPVAYEGDVPSENTRLVEIFNTDNPRFGGKGTSLNGMNASASAIKIAPLSTVMFRYETHS